MIKRILLLTLVAGSFVQSAMGSTAKQRLEAKRAREALLAAGVSTAPSTPSVTPVTPAPSAPVRPMVATTGKPLTAKERLALRQAAAASPAATPGAVSMAAPSAPAGILIPPLTPVIPPITYSEDDYNAVVAERDTLAQQVADLQQAISEKGSAAQKDIAAKAAELAAAKEEARKNRDGWYHAHSGLMLMGQIIINLASTKMCGGLTGTKLGVIKGWIDQSQGTPDEKDRVYTHFKNNVDPTTDVD